MGGGSDVVVLNNVTYHLSKLSAEEKFRIEHLKYHEDHKGHERMHLEIYVDSPVCIQYIRGIFKICRCLGLVFSNTGAMVYLSCKKRISTTTPRRVYRWFLFIHTTSYVLGIGGYILMMLTFFQVNLLFFLPTKIAMDFALLVLFYGLYYGVIARDFAEVCTNKMAAQISYRVPQGMPIRRIDASVCSICTNDLVTDGGEKVHRLNCTHVFHDFCIRAGALLERKIPQTFTNPWDKPHILYGNLLDWVRYLVAWQPVILGLVQLLNSALGLQ
ncbi:unnamed protein product [Heterobilharzia americana]|nr:unnamed protein product [Heterobilharzia americana]